MSTLDDREPQAARGPAQQVRRPARAVAPPIVISAATPSAGVAGESDPSASLSPVAIARAVPESRPAADAGQESGRGGPGDVIDIVAVVISSEPGQAEATGAGDEDGVTRVERRDPAMLAQLAEALALIARGGEPFGSFALPAPGPRAGELGGADAGAGARGGQRRRGERKAIAPTASPAEAARQQGGDSAHSETPSEAARWPTGPIVGYDQLSARELEGLVEKMLCDPEIMGDPTYPGLSRQRLRTIARQAGLEAHRFGKFSPWVELWLARAGITARRVSTEGEWDSPRPVQLEEKDEIRRALLSTPWPTRRDIEEARAQGLGEGVL